MIGPEIALHQPLWPIGQGEALDAHVEHAPDLGDHQVLVPIGQGCHAIDAAAGFLLPLRAGIIEALDDKHRKIDIAEREQRTGLGESAILEANLRPDAGLVHLFEARFHLV